MANIAIYTFNSSTDTLPTFNDEYTYDYTDVYNSDGTKTRTITSNGKPTSIKFTRATGLVSVSYLDTSELTSMEELFYECTNLISLDTSGWDTSNVTDVKYMFYKCSSLTTLNLSNWDLNKLSTSAFDCCDYTLDGCTNLSTIYMLNCDAETTIFTIMRECNLPSRTAAASPGVVLLNSDELDEFRNTSAYGYSENRNWKFYIPVAKYTFTSSTDTLPTFNSEYNYIYSDVVSGSNTIRTIFADDAPTSVSFKNKNGLISLSKLNTSNLTSMEDMFYFCSNLTNINLKD